MRANIFDVHFPHHPFVTKHRNTSNYNTYVLLRMQTNNLGIIDCLWEIKQDDCAAG